MLKIMVMYAKIKAKYYKKKRSAHKWILKYEAWLMFAVAIMVIGLPFLFNL
jgi:hypothetical protein